MKEIYTFVIILMALTACTAPQANMPNHAWVYCKEQGNKHEIRMAADGSQNGICVFPDGSECDEWAYFRGECGLAQQKSPTPAMTAESTTDASGGYMPPGIAEEISDWWGVIKSTKPGAQYDDYFERQDLGQIINFGID